MNPCASFHICFVWVVVCMCVNVLCFSLRLSSSNEKLINFHWEWTDWNKLDGIQSVAKFTYSSNENGLSTYIFFILFFHINFVFISIIVHFFDRTFEHLFKLFQANSINLVTKRPHDYEIWLVFVLLLYPITICNRTPAMNISIQCHWRTTTFNCSQPKKKKKFYSIWLKYCRLLQWGTVN